MKYAVRLLGLCLALGLLSACSSANPLDKALQEYVNWKTITVTGQTRGNIHNFRSDGEYRTLLKAFNESSSSDYAALASWVEKHQKDIPAPLYWDLAGMALKEKKPKEVVLKWMFIGQGSGRYDVTRCKDMQSSFGAFAEILYTHNELVKLVKDNPEQSLTAWTDSLQWLRMHPYTASPMWVCSQGMPAFAPTTSQPAKYADLVTPDSQLKMGWTEYLDSVAKVLDEYKAGKRHF